MSDGLTAAGIKDSEVLNKAGNPFKQDAQGFLYFVSKTVKRTSGGTTGKIYYGCKYMHQYIAVHS